VLLYKGKIDADEIGLWSQSSLEKGKNQAPKDMSNRFDRVFCGAWYLERVVHGGVSSGTAVYCSLIASQGYPILFSIKPGAGGHPPRELQEFYYRGYTGTRMADHFLNTNDLPSWPTAFVLVRSGQKSKRVAEFAARIKELRSRIVKDLKRFGENN